MSAPKTNIDRQISRHRGPLLGMVAVAAFVAVLFLGWLLYETDSATDATEAPVDLPAAASPERSTPLPDSSINAAPENSVTPSPPASVP